MHESIAESSSITPADIKATKSRLQAKIPSCGVKWKEILLKFTNLLFVLFRGECPLYIKMLAICKAIRKYKQDILDGVPIHAKASILWIIHKQSRHFAQAKMSSSDLPSSCLPEFQMMYNMILANAIHRVSVAGLPLQLEQTTHPVDALKHGNTTGSGGPGSKTTEDKPEGPAKKKVKVQQERPWHPKLKAALAGPMRQAGFPSLRLIANFCGLAKDDTIVPDSAPDECRQNIMFGRCRYGNKCNNKHVTASDAQAQTILSKFERFINAPDELRGETT